MINVFDREINTISIYGDSVFKGVTLNDVDDRYSSNNAHIVVDISARYDLTLRNYSLFGSTVTKGMKNFTSDIRLQPKPDMAIFEFGGNDCDYNWNAVGAAPDAEHNCKTPPDIFFDEYSKLLTMATENGILPIAVIPPPIDAEAYLNWICYKGASREGVLKWLNCGSGRIYRYQEYYGMLSQRIAESCSAQVIDLRTPFLNRRDFHELFCRDGIHPNAKGQALIEETLIDLIDLLSKKGH